MRKVRGLSSKLPVETVPLADLLPDPANPRLHEERSVAAIAGSLKRWGQQKPIVVDTRGMVVAGHGVLEAARRLGWTHLEVVRTGLDGIERAAYAIADNRTAELSRWDDEALRRIVAAIPSEVAEAAGYSGDELAELLSDQGLEQDTPPAALPHAVTRAGELWRLGDHRLLCGSSIVDADVDRLMDGKRAALVATDPPYLVDYTGERAGGTGKDWSSVYREVDLGDAGPFFLALFRGVVRVMAEHAAIYCWHAHRRVGTIQAVWRELGILDHQQVVWVKPTPVFGSCMYHFQHEPCMVGWLQGSKPRHDGRHDASSVWVLPWSPEVGVQVRDDSDVWVTDWEGKSRPVGNEHPTQKPVELFARPMRKHTQRGDVCYEPFSGSGTQLVAGEQLGRVVYAMELEPRFVDVAVRRWQALTAREAVLDGDGADGGRTWSELAAARTPPADDQPRLPAEPRPARKRRATA